MPKPTTTTTSPIDPAATYAVTMHRPVPMGIVTYRPDQIHRMTGATVLSVLAAAGGDADTVLTATAIAE